MDLHHGHGPLFIGHRGLSSEAPENTLSAINLAWEKGVKAVEIDVHLTADHRIVVHHDKTTTKALWKDYKISNTDSHLLRQLDVGSWLDDRFKGEKIPFLEEVLHDLPKDHLLVIDVKCGAEIIPFLKHVLAESGKLDQIHLMSYGVKTIVALKKHFPEVPCYWVFKYEIVLRQKLFMVKKLGLQGVKMHFSIIQEKLVDQALRLGLDIISSRVAEPKEARRLINLGVTKVVSTKPVWLKKEMGY